MLTIIIFSVISSAFSMPNPENPEPTVANPVRALKKDCANGILNPSCLKIGAMSLLEKLNSKDELALIPGVSLVKEGSDPKAEAVTLEIARSLATEPEERLDKFLVYQVGKFLDTHAVKLRLLDDAAVDEARSMIEEGRGKNPLSMGGKKGGMGGLMAMAMMMKSKFF